jgi:hypothetical protein
LQEVLPWHEPRACSSPDQHDFDTGYDPSVALTNDEVVVEVHGSRRSTSGYLYYHVGKLNGGDISFPKNAIRVGKDQGSDPSIALNQKNHIVEVHVGASSKLYYRVGLLQPDKFEVDWWDYAKELPRTPTTPISMRPSAS